MITKTPAFVFANASRPRSTTPVIPHHTTTLTNNTLLLSDALNYPCPQALAIRTNKTMSGPQEPRTAIALYNVEQYEVCVNFINRVYLDTTPLYRRLRYNILLACCLEDWHEAEVRKPL